MEEEEGRRGHPLLRGGGKEKMGRYGHGFSSSQMEVLAAMCEAFIPSVSSAEEVNSINGGKKHPPSKDLLDFYMASGSRSPVPNEAIFLLRGKWKQKNICKDRLVMEIINSIDLEEKDGEKEKN
ncbi:Long-chain-alcohol oxidase FAO2 [Platanthera guangdongensis]|uniref:Long-chain-alcohol oxidase FAO2 n=1 Tax=Platanthera guangdongensis TaxID=2320717 RepID=A0ABR2M531_9ASPA